MTEQKRRRQGPWVLALVVTGVLLAGGWYVLAQNSDEPVEAADAEGEAKASEEEDAPSRSETEEHMRSIGYVQ